MCLKNADEWSSLANFLSNMIAKYADVLDFDSMPDPESPSEDTKTNEIDTTNFKKDIADCQAA